MMAAYKLPKRIFIWESIARAESGKVLKSALREEIYARNLMHRE
jgi:acyl-CoA synthetase (AMP-forming)/AMP-acid ligase II